MDENEIQQDAILLHYGDCLNFLRASIEGLQGPEWDYSRGQDEWTIREIVHHVADGDYLWKTCIQMALGESEHAFHLKWYWETEQAQWAHLWAYASRDTEASLALLAANRNHVVELLSKIPGSLSRTVLIEWPEGDRQEVTIQWVLEMQTHHVEGHADEIRRIREVHGF